MRLPTYVNVSKTNTKAVNLNIYRNLHYHHLNKQKQNFHDIVEPLLKNVPRADLVAIHYTIYAARNGRLDTMNVGSVLDKYFSDTLVESGKIPDDDYKHIIMVSFSFGGVSALDGYAEAEIFELEKERDNMRVLLDQKDIEEALNTWVDNAGFPGATGVELTIVGDSVEAEVMFAGQEEETPEPAPKKNRGGRPKGSKNKPKPVEKVEVADVDGLTEAGSDDSDSGGSGAAKADTQEGNDETKVKNPFEDEETESSESAEKPEDTETGGAEADAPVKTKKKSSIFDD